MIFLSKSATDYLMNVPNIILDANELIGICSFLGTFESILESKKSVLRVGFTFMYHSRALPSNVIGPLACSPARPRGPVAPRRLSGSK